MTLSQNNLLRHGDAPASPAPLEKWLITLTVMLVAIIEVLDMTIINVSLNQMMGAFESTSEQITWILTGYLVSSAIVMPLTGLLVQRLGCRRLLLINIIGFLITSMLCGLATNLGEIVSFRILQGVFGAALVPISQFVIRDTFSDEEQNKGMAIWGMGIMVAPVLGPTLGGYITQHLSWRWIFYMNVPICLIAFLLALTFIKETPRKKTHIDWLGLFLMIVGIGLLQIVLDRGNQSNWFESNTILVFSFISAAGLIAFIARGWQRAGHIITLTLFKDRHFLVSTLLMTCYPLIVFSVLTVQPIMLEILMNYPPNTAGLVMAPRGLTSALGMFLSIPLAKYLDGRWLLATGILISAFGTYLMTRFNLNDSFWVLTYPGIIQGIGIGLTMVPLSKAAFDYLPASTLPEAAGLFSFGRSIGISIGISVLSTLITRQTEVNWQRLGAHIQQFNPNWQAWLAKQGLSMQDPTAIAHAAQLVSRQANMIAFIDGYWAMTIALLLILPLVLLLKPSKTS